MDNMKKTVTIYVTKYALTDGVLQREGVLTKSGGYSYRRNENCYSDYVYDKDVHLTESSAVARAEEMRSAKLKSLEKQMKKVSAKKFEVK